METQDALCSLRFFAVHIQNLAGHAREFRVTRKVNLADRSAGYQCHSIFTQA